MGKPIVLSERRNELVEVATDAYNYMVCLPKSLRPDDKERTGIQIMIREPATRNLVFFSVGQPPEASMVFATEKAVRSWVLGDLTSQNSEEPFIMEFRGSVTFTCDGITNQASVSGLLADDDVAIAIKLLSVIFGKPARDICRLTAEKGGDLPACFGEEGHYLWEYIRDN